MLKSLDEKRRAVCTRIWQGLLGQSESDRARILAEWRAEAASTLPQGLDRLHPSWILAALEGEPAHIVRIVLRGLPEPLQAMVRGLPGMLVTDAQPAKQTVAQPEAIRREVQRLALGWLAPLCENVCGPLAERLLGHTFDELLSDVTRRGARTVGQSLAGAAPALRARAMVAAGEPWAQVIGQASTESLPEPDRKIAMAHAKTRIPASARTPRERLLHVGLAVLKSELVAEHEGSIYRVAGRLPVALGRAMIGW
jgi:hypothetical protein